MSLADFLTAEQQNKSQLAPYLDAQYRMYSEGANNTLAAMRAITKTKRDGYEGDNPIIAANFKYINEEQGKQEAQMRKEAVDEYFSAQQEATNAMLADEPVYDEADNAAVVDLVNENYMESMALSRAERDLMRILAPDVAKNVLDIMADDLFVKNEMRRVAEDMGMNTDTLLDGLSLLFVNDQSFTTKEISDGSWFSSAADLAKYVDEIKAIPDAEDRREAIKQFLSTVKDTTGNSLDQLYYLDALDTGSEGVLLNESLDKAGLVFDAVTVAGIGSTFLPAAIAGVTASTLVNSVKVAGKVKRFVEVLQDTNAVKAAAKAGAVEDAAQMNEIAAKDANIAKVLDISQDAAQSNYLPFSFEGILAGASDELAVELHKYSAEYQKMQKLINGDLVKEGLKLTPAEAERFGAETKKALEKADDVAVVKPLDTVNNGMQFEITYASGGADAFSKTSKGVYTAGNASIVKNGNKWDVKIGEETVKTFLSKTGAERYAMAAEDIQAAMQNGPKRIITVAWDEDALDGYKVVEDGLGLTKGFFASPNIKFFTDRLQLVLPAVRTQYQQARLRQELNRMYTEALAPLGNRFTPSAKRSREKIGAILQYGDQFDNGPLKETGKVFSVTELRHGVLFPDGSTVKLADNEIEAYYKSRMLMDNLHYIEDQRLLDLAKQRGTREIIFGGEKGLGIPFDSAKSAKTASGDNYIYDSRVNRMVPMEEAELADAYNSGYKVVRTEQYNKVTTVEGADESSKYLLIHANDIKDTPKTLLNYRQGYLPKITDDGIFFVKQNQYSLVNGRRAATNKNTLGMFTTRAKASKFAAAQRAKAIQAAIANGKTEKQAIEEVGDMYEVLRDRELPTDALSAPSIFGSGPYTGARSSREIFLDEEGNMPVRINAYEAIQRSIGHASSAFPMATLRHNLQQRWLASAKKFLPPEFQSDFNQAINHLEFSDQFDDRKRSLTQMHSYIRHVIGVPSDAQMQTQAAVHRFADSLEKRGWDKAAALTNKYAKGRSISDTARAITFHSLLGGFNMSQFIVQGLGSTVAMAIDPKNYVAATRLSMAMNALDQTSTPKEFEAVKSLLVKSKIISAEDIDNIYDGWRRSGLRDDLLNNADFSEFSRHWEMTKAVAEAGTLPFRMGEAAHRRYTFANAYLQQAKGQKLTDEVLQQVMNRQTDLSMNMSRMNKAAWQEGAILGVATQFRQVTAKYMEALLGKQFTGKEKLALIGGQMALFGFHGVPFGSGIQQAAQGYYGWDQDNLPVGFQRFLNEGTFRMAMDAVGMEDLNIVSRVAIGESLTDLWDVTNTDSLIEFLGGPAYSHVGKGLGNTFMKSIDTLRFFGSTDYKFSSKVQSAQELGAKVASGIPIVDDVTKAFMYARGLQLDSKGRVISEERDISWQEVIGIALGFSDRAPSDIFISQSLRSDSDKRINELVDDVAARMRKRFVTGSGLSEEDKDIILFNILTRTANEDEQRRVNKLVVQALTEEPRLERELNAVWSLLYNRGQAIQGGGMSELMLQTQQRTEEAVNGE